MNLVDTSGWLEFFAGSSRARHFEKAILNTGELLVPVICIYEVFKKLLAEYGEDEALKAAGHMKTGVVAGIDAGISVEAARISRQYGIPMADSLIYACAVRYGATVYTQDADFKPLPHVKYFKK